MSITLRELEDAARPTARTVTRAEYDAIECNRCGLCCEGFWLPPLAKIAHYLIWALHKCTPNCGDDADDHEKWRRIANWLMNIEPVTPASGVANSLYRCNFFIDGQCTIYDERPLPCRMFPTEGPYMNRRIAKGLVVEPNIARCSWHVRVLDFEPLLGEEATT